MSRPFRRFAAGVAVAGPLLLLGAAVLYAAGARVNTTRSVPVGLYWVTDAPADPGAYVVFCPPPVAVFFEARARGYIGAGPCPGNLGFVFKKILAAKNDAVFIGGDGVRVNGILVSNSAPRTVDKAGRTLPNCNIERAALEPSEVLLMSDVSATSFDGRYYGLIDRAQIRAVITPVLTW